MRLFSQVLQVEPLFAVIDVETTGLFASRADRIVEVAVVTMTPTGEVVDDWTTLVDPGRDIGPTSIHGLTARHVDGAPVFADIVGDLLQRLGGRILVGHNAIFDIGFLQAELNRAGYSVDLRPGLCTMRLASSLHVGARSLSACCEARGIQHARAHEADEDARVTGQLLMSLLSLAAEERLRVEMPGSVPTVPCQAACERSHRRPTQTAREISAVASLVGRMPQPAVPIGADPDAVLSYAALLDRVLEDRRLTAEEVEALAELAVSWGLTIETLAKIHDAYFNGLISLAMADGVLTDIERDDLADVARLLGVPDLAGAFQSWNAAPTLVAGRVAEFHGLSVCFTGESVCSIGGEPMDRAIQERLARDVGMVTLDNVTKKLDILVLADAASKSGKARKAEEYGIRKMAERSFWSALGVLID